MTGIAKLLLGRAMPMGAAALLLKSSYSPIQPALAAFGAATNALSGQSTQDSGADFDKVAQEAQGQIQQAQGGGLKSILDKLFSGGSHPDAAKKQLDDIIQHVKDRGGDAPDPGPQPPSDSAHVSQPASAPGNKKGAGKAPSHPKK